MVTWTSVIDDTFQRANTTAGAAGSTTGVGNGWIDLAGGIGNITSDQLVMTSNNGSGYLTQLILRPSGETAINTRVTRKIVGAPGCNNGIVLRVQGSNGTYYLCNAINSGILIYTVVASSVQNVGNLGLSEQMVAGTDYLLDFNATSAGGQTSLAISLKNLTSGVVIGGTASNPVIDTTPALQTAGVPGLVVWGTGSTTDAEVVTYQGDGSAQSIVFSPTSVTAGVAGQVVNVTGTGTSFSGSPFTISGGYGAALTAQSVASGTSGSFTLSPGLAGQGVLTVTAGIATAALTVNPPNLGPLVLGFVGDSITAGTNGTTVTGTQTVLQNAGYTVTINNQGVSGSSSQDWLPSGSGFQNALTAFRSAGVSWCMIMLGTNDPRTPNNLTASQHHTNMAAIVAALVAAGIKVLLNKPLFTKPNTAFSGVAWPNDPNAFYNAAYVMDLALVDGLNVYQGDTANYSMTANNLALLSASDGVHPADQPTNTLVGENWAVAFLNRLGATGSGGAVTPTYAGGFHP